MKNHDDTVIDGVQLDCYLYTEDEARCEDADAFLTIHDGRIISDNGSAAALQERVRQYVAQHTVTDPAEKAFIISWIRKTTKRMERCDDEGSYRAVAFLWESLADYFILRDMFYFGSKKAIRYLKAQDAEGYALFSAAVRQRTDDDIIRWADHVVKVSAE